MLASYDENTLNTAIDIIENIESHYGRLAECLGEVRKTIPSENVEVISDKCFELSVEVTRYKQYFSSVKKRAIRRQDMSLVPLS
ncbi:hypothetical protein HER14_03975 [Acidithiobacillus thiooxidans]|uniref:hypothetical protein n=1 Tax=Acidithiobacillus thiooxidans TaxID=930 RepID=UPI001C07AC18|nr:hypothetical protein [Acidithiobacillus thiooxidans]MBU2750117.1 hypothetical protein [Acidithiobacillus thiooxidans]